MNRQVIEKYLEKCLEEEFIPCLCCGCDQRNYENENISALTLDYLTEILEAQLEQLL